MYPDLQLAKVKISDENLDTPLSAGLVIKTDMSILNAYMSNKILALVDVLDCICPCNSYKNLITLKFSSTKEKWIFQLSVTY